jgi:hypothetical protein
VKPPALRALAELAEGLARLARAAAQEDDPAPNALVPLDEAARLAATSKRVLRDALRAGELPGYGRARDRAVRREDLERWIAARRMLPFAAVDDDDLARRVHRLARVRAHRKVRRVGQAD